MTAMAPGMAMGGMGPGLPPVDPSAVMLQMLQQLMGKWGSQEAQLAGEQGALTETILMLLQAQPPSPEMGFAEGGPPSNFGMGGGPQQQMMGGPVGY